MKNNLITEDQINSHLNDLRRAVRYQDPSAKESAGSGQKEYRVLHRYSLRQTVDELILSAGSQWVSVSILRAFNGANLHPEDMGYVYLSARDWLVKIWNERSVLSPTKLDFVKFVLRSPSGLHTFGDFCFFTQDDVPLTVEVLNILGKALQDKSHVSTCNLDEPSLRAALANWSEWLNVATENKLTTQANNLILGIVGQAEHFIAQQAGDDYRLDYHWWKEVTWCLRLSRRGVTSIDVSGLAAATLTFSIHLDQDNFLLSCKMIFGEHQALDVAQMAEAMGIESLKAAQCYAFFVDLLRRKQFSEAVEPADKSGFVPKTPSL